MYTLVGAKLISTHAFLCTEPISNYPYCSISIQLPIRVWD